MVHLDATRAHRRRRADKGLKGGALGFISSVVVGVASTAPAYSLAATLGFVVVAINGLQAPIVTILAFVPMLFISFGYKELNNADPDCGTTFTWAHPGVRARRPVARRLGHRRRRRARDGQPGPDRRSVRVPAVQRRASAGNASSGWVLLVGILWIVVMTAICYVGHRDLGQLPEGPARDRAHYALVLFSIVALVKVGSGHAPAGHLTPSWTWFNPFNDQPRQLHRRVHADALHLLGMGHRGLGERGDEGPAQDPRPGGRALDGDPAGHLRHRGPGHRSPMPASAPRASASGTRPTRTTS